MKDDERRAKEQERAQKELEKQRQAQIKAQNKAELSKFSLTFLKNLVSGYKERAQKIRKEKEDRKLKIKLIKFCIRHFDDYEPKLS